MDKVSKIRTMQTNHSKISRWLMKIEVPFWPQILGVTEWEYTLLQTVYKMVIIKSKRHRFAFISLE